MYSVYKACYKVAPYNYQIAGKSQVFYLSTVL